MSRRFARFALTALVAAHAVIGLDMLFDSSLRRGEFADRSDPVRYQAIAQKDGRPWQDFEVEYPPVLVTVVEAIDTGDFDSFLSRLILLQVAADIACGLLLLKGWGHRAAVSYLVLSMPLLPILYTKLDFLAVLAALLAVLLVRHGRERAGGVTLAVATFTKLWTVALAPLLLVRARWRTLATAAAVGGAGLVGWVAFAGVDGPIQVATFRGARGWQLESFPANLLLLFQDPAVRHESGAWRVGNMPGALGLLLVAVGLGLALAAALLARSVIRRVDTDFDEFGTPAAVAIAGLLVSATLFSPQFMIWLVPFAAIAAAQGDRTTERLTFVAVLLTVFEMVLFDAHRNDGFVPQVLLWGRNLTVGAVAVAGLRSLRGMARAAIPQRPSWSPEASFAG